MEINIFCISGAAISVTSFAAAGIYCLFGFVNKYSGMTKSLYTAFCFQNVLEQMKLSLSPIPLSDYGFHVVVTRINLCPIK